MTPNHDPIYNPKPQSSFSSLKTTPIPSPKPEKRGRRFWRRARRSLGWCFGISVAAFFLANLTASWLLHRELAAIVQRGEPLRLVDLAPARLSEAENAATVYLRAAAALTLTSAEKERLRNTKSIEPETDVLAKNQTAIKLTRQAAAISGCRFPVDYEATNMAGILFPHLTQMREMAGLLRAQAIQESKTGHIDAALNDAAVLFRMSEHLAPEPTLIAGLTGIAIERVGYKTLARVLKDAKLSPDQAHAFSLRLPRTDWTTAFSIDLLGERCFGLWAFQYVSNPLEAVQLLNSPAAPSSNILVGKGLGALWSPLWKMDEIQYLRANARQQMAFQKPGTPMISDDKLFKQMPLYAICTRIMMPVLSQVGTRRDEAVVYRRMAVVALACNAYQTRNGHIPANLREAEAVWGNDLPHDLYTNQSFCYKCDGEQTLLYSAGPNRIDEGGRHPDKSLPNFGYRHDASKELDDIVW